MILLKRRILSLSKPFASQMALKYSWHHPGNPRGLLAASLVVSMGTTQVSVAETGCWGRWLQPLQTLRTLSRSCALACGSTHWKERKKIRRGIKSQSKRFCEVVIHCESPSLDKGMWQKEKKRKIFKKLATFFIPTRFLHFLKSG